MQALRAYMQVHRESISSEMKLLITARQGGITARQGGNRMTRYNGLDEAVILVDYHQEVREIPQFALYEPYSSELRHQFQKKPSHNWKNEGF